MLLLRITFLVLALPGIMFAQGVMFGIDWDNPGTDVDLEQKILFFKQNGIEIIQVEGIQNRSTIERLTEEGFDLWLSSGIKFPRRFDFENSFDDLQTNITDPLHYYRNNRISFQRFSILENPQLFPGFEEKMERLISDVRSVYKGSLDVIVHQSYRGGPELNVPVSWSLTELDFASPLVRELEIIHLNRSALIPNPSWKLREILSEIPSDTLFVFLTDKDFIYLSNKDPHFLEVVNSFTSNRRAVIALPRVIPNPNENTAVSIALVVSIFIFLALFLTNAGYQRSIYRYLFNHNFFLNDVFMKRVRFGPDVFFSWLLTLIFGGLLFHLMFKVIFVGVNLDFMLHYVPYLVPLIKSGFWGGYFTGVFVIFGLQLLTIIWLVASSAGLVNITQVFQLFFIPQQIIVACSILATIIFINGGGSFWILFFGLIAVLSVPLSLTIISANISGYINNGKTRLLLLGPVLFNLGLTVLGGWLFINTPFGDSLQMLLQFIH